MSLVSCAVVLCSGDADASKGSTPIVVAMVISPASAKSAILGRLVDEVDSPQLEFDRTVRARSRPCAIEDESNPPSAVSSKESVVVSSSAGECTPYDDPGRD
jgi:hypothetical protein